MKILVISDTHTKNYRAQKLIDIYRENGLKHVIHCGDHISDAKALKEANKDMQIYMVPGNCDFSTGGAEKDLIVDIEGVKFFITHGDRHHVKYNYEELYIDAEAYGAEIIVFGHTHSAHKEEKNGIKLLNPGSITQPRDTQFPSFAVVEIVGKKVVDLSVLQMQGANTIVRHPYY